MIKSHYYWDAGASQVDANGGVVSTHDASGTANLYWPVRPTYVDRLGIKVSTRKSRNQRKAERQRLRALRTRHGN